MPVTVKLYVPAGVLLVVNRVKIEFAEIPEERVTLRGFRFAERPVTGGTVPESETGPAKPPRLVTVIVEVPLKPALMVRDVGLALTLKSVTVTAMLTE